MNWEHFKTFVWLRWRLRINQLKKAGKGGIILLVTLIVLAVVAAIGSFIGLYILGSTMPQDSGPAAFLYAWDVVVGVFLFFWAVGILADLQRAESLSIDKFLHLPVSVSGAFVINYISSLVTPSLFIFVPAFLGLIIGLTSSRGSSMLSLVPVTLAFFFMVTAITYQFRGWLASIMTNPRRRRMVIVIATAVFVVIAQTPNLINLGVKRGFGVDIAKQQEIMEKMSDLKDAHEKKQISGEEYSKRLRQLKQEQAAGIPAKPERSFERVEQLATYVNVALPPGWLPLGAYGIAGGMYLPATLALFGMTLIGVASLWRGYRTTLRLYTGQYTSGQAIKRPVGRAPERAEPKPRGSLLVERQLPWVSEQAAAVATSGLRGLIRAPESKMMLLSPIMMLVVFGGLMFSRTGRHDWWHGPLVAYAAMAMTLLSMSQFFANQFGFDRDGFKVFVMTAAPRREILLGKNLSLAPIVFGLGLIVIVPLQFLFPLQIGHILTLPMSLLTMFLLFCMIMNWASIIAPMRISPGSLKPSGTKLVPFLVNLSMIILVPLCLAPTLLPLGAGVLLESYGWQRGHLYCFVLAVIEVILIVLLYRIVIGWQGRMLQRRELKIMNSVITKAE